MTPASDTRVDGPAPIRIEARTGWPGFGLREAWEWRELLVFLVERDVRVRYKQTVFGATWAVAQPVITMVLFTVVFGRVAGLPSEGVPYPLFSLAGTVPWALVAGGLTAASASLVQNEALVKQVYVHKMLVPASSVLANVVDVLIAIVVLVCVAAGYGYWPSPRLLVLPALVALGVAVVLGVALVLCAVNVLYRDVRILLPYVIQVWLFATPVAYSVTAVDEENRWLFALNPLVGVVEGVRWAVLGTGNDLPLYLASSVGGAAVGLLFGGYVFRRLEPSFADVV